MTFVIGSDLVYPADPAARTRWIQSRRAPKNRLDPGRPYAFLREEEVDAHAETVSTATVFLTNRECPFRCLMCDLWQNTLDERSPPGAIPAQIAYALERLGPARQIKLYNAGSFFDAGAIPPGDHAAIAEAVHAFERVVVECHPTLVGERCAQFRDRIAGRLEVALGLETVHPDVLARLNKRMTVESFLSAAAFLRANDIGLRVFLLVRPPFLSEHEGVEWAKRSLDTALEAGATVCALIPTRAGNGAMDALHEAGDFTPPHLASLEAAQRYGLERAGRQARVFSDLWDIQRFFTCACSPQRAARLAEMNQTQRVLPAMACAACGYDQP